MKNTLAVISGIMLATTVSAAEPVLRVGIMTDTHIRSTRESCKLVQGAFEVFRDHKVELVVNLGDIADRHFPEGYKHYSDIFNEVFGKNPPQELLIYANHDTIDQPDWDTAFAAVEKLIGATNKPYDFLELKGYPFLVYPQRVDFKRMETEIQNAIAKYPGKPIFVLDHAPARFTTDNSGVWGCPERRKLLDKYPQVIHLDGHTHNSLHNEKCIWQGGFTTVNAGCLQTWAGDLVGTCPASKRAYDVLVMEVFPESIVFRRISVLDKSEYHKDRPWTVAWPYDPANAVYSPEARKATDVPPEFPADAELALSKDNTNFTELHYTFPFASHPDGVYIYRIELERKDANGNWELFARQDANGEFWHEAAAPAQTASGGPVLNVSGKLSAGYFDEGREYRIRVTPCSFFGKEGKPLVAQYKAEGIRRGTVVFESNDPMKDCPFKTGLADGKTPELKDGYYTHNGSNNRLEFPAGVWDGPAKTVFRFVVDFSKDQPGNGQWTVVLRNPSPLTNANERISTCMGNTPLQRLVIDFKKAKDFYTYYLLVREGAAGKIRFNYVRIERF